MRSALVLNATYEPLSVVPARRAACLVLADKADLVARRRHRAALRDTCALPNPLVIRLRYVVKVPYHRRTALSRRAVFARDDHRCQYCGGHADSIDHVMPRGPRRPHVWENVAAACRPCNLHKRDRTPDEADMRLATLPRAPREQAWVVSPSGACRRRGSRTSPAPVDVARRAPLTGRRRRSTPARCPIRPRGRCGCRRGPAGTGAGVDPAARRGRRRRLRGAPASRSCAGAAAGERCCSCRARSLWVDVLVPAGDAAVGRRRRRRCRPWCGRAWALGASAAARCTGRDGAHGVVGPGLLRRHRPGRGGARRPQGGGISQRRTRAVAGSSAPSTPGGHPTALVGLLCADVPVAALPPVATLADDVAAALPAAVADALTAS